MTNPFGTDLHQTGDWRPSVLGLAVGGATIGGLWLAWSRGAELDGLVVVTGGIAAAFLGALVLALKKDSWSPALQWWAEALGIALMSPLFVALSLFGFFPIGPWDFAGPERRV